MNYFKIATTLKVILMSSALISGCGLAEQSMSQKLAATKDSVSTNIDRSMNKVDNYMDDSTVTAKVKAALVGDETIVSSDISVNTHKSVVTLSGFVSTQQQAEKAVMLAGRTDGVKSVSDKLHVKESKKETLKSYAGDSATTSEIKAKFLADDNVPSRHVKVVTTHGVVQLTGKVNNRSQMMRAEEIAKAVKGVKSVKNDLTVAP